MKVLLDTHALLWWATGDRQLTKKAKAAIAAEDNSVYVSAASAWEIATKVRLGKLAWPATAGTVGAYVLRQAFRPLPISIEHAERAGQLPIDHRDPFDRMLAAQALSEGVSFISADTIFDTYGVSRLW